MSEKLILSRRRFLTGSAAAAAGLTLATSRAFAGGNIAGGPMPFLAQSANIPTPREKTLVINMGETNVYDSFNPYVPNGEAQTYGMHQICREPFFIENFMTGELVPWLAESHEYNKDFTELTLKIRKEATWSDGKPYSADDVVFTFDMLKKHEDMYGGSDAADLKGWKKVDDKTVTFMFKEPNPRYHLQEFAAGTWSQWIRIVPKHIWEGQDPLTFKNPQCVYSGPYKLKEARFDQKYYLWEKNPNYWNKSLNFAPEFILFRQQTSSDATVQEFLRGDVDVPGMDALNQQMVLSSYDKVVQASYSDPCPRGFSPNHLSPMFTTPEGRWALSYLTDRKTIADTIWYPQSRPAVYPWPDWPTNDKWKIDDLQKKYDLSVYDPNKAAELLDKIGITMDGDKRKKDGKDFTVGIISPSAVGSAEYEIARLVASAAQGIGLNMEVVNLQSATYGDAVNTGKYDVESNWLCLGSTDPYGTYAQAWAPKEGEKVTPIGTKAETNQMRVNLPKFREIATKLGTVSPEDTKNPVYREGLEYFYQQLPVIPTIQTVYPFVFNTTYWAGWPSDKDGVKSSPKHDLATFIQTVAGLKPAQ